MAEVQVTEEAEGATEVEVGVVQVMATREEDLVVIVMEVMEAVEEVKTN